MMKKLIFIFITLILLGCTPSNDTMKERLKDYDILVVTDNNGNLYTIEHNIGNTYIVKPLKKVK